MTSFEVYPEVATGFSAHDWQGKVFLIWVYGIAAVWMLLSLLFLIPSVNETPLGALEALLLLGLAGIHVAIARGVSRFRTWAWWGGILMAIATLPLGALFLYYFVTRRARFKARPDASLTQ